MTTTLPNVIRAPGLTTTGYTITREIPGIGVLKFEDYPAGSWLTQKGEPAKKARRRYLLGETEMTADTELDAVSSIGDTLSKAALLRWIEDQATRGAVTAERLGELQDVHEDDWMERVKALGLGASAKKEMGADRGSAVHVAAHTLATEGKPPNPSTYMPEWRPWLQGMTRAWLALEPEIIEAEAIVCYPEHGYAGRFDLLARVDDAVAVLDYKTGKGRVFDSAHYTTRLYSMAVQRSLGIEVERTIIIGVDDDGGFQLVECEATEADALALLHTFRSRKRINSGMASQRRIAKAAAA